MSYSQQQDEPYNPTRGSTRFASSGSEGKEPRQSGMSSQESSMFDPSMQQQSGMQQSSGMQSGGAYGSSGQDEWDDDTQQSYGQSTGMQQQQSQPMGQKARGGAEKASGRMTGQSGTMERGRERQEYRGQESSEDTTSSGQGYGY